MISAQGWDRYNGGLDTHNDMTGTHSYFTLFEEHQVMFHVSTLLPYSNEDTQQVFLVCTKLFTNSTTLLIYAIYY